MEFSTHFYDEIARVYVSGDLLGLQDEQALGEAFDDLLAQGYQRFILDLSEVQHINSSGLGLLIRMYNQLSDIGGGLVLLNGSKNTLRLMKITKLDQVFTNVLSLEDALSFLHRK